MIQLKGKITEFKLAGRGSLPNLCENVVGYMIKPEFQLGVMKELIINGWK